VAGTHGKTTTSSLIAHLLHHGGMPVNAFLGGIATNFNSNLVLGDSEWVVVEADEFDRSFLTLSPEMAVVTAVDPDHLDIYGTAASFYDGFASFIGKIKEQGTLIWKQGIPLSMAQIRPSIWSRTYGNDQANIRSEALRVESGTYVFNYVNQDIIIKDIKCGLPGIHNVENALAAISIALKCGIKTEAIHSGMASFCGVKRRFERVLVKDTITVIDDYAHHPTEIRAAIQSVRDLYPNQRVLGIFQPHLFSRTRDFGDEFAMALSALDEIILLPIYPARELPIDGIDSQWLFNKISNPSKKLLEKSELLEIGISEHWDVVLFLGAGDIDQLVHPLTQRLNDERK
jgi:UDP-N-acetylmuramate--alanine ligase